MRKVLFFISLILLASCSSDDGKFSLKGKFKNFNQGELYVYDLMGRTRMDTIKLADGKFYYEKELDEVALLSVIFPNFSEIPVIAAPGTSATMEGDASHLREVKVTGTDDNKLLTQFRQHINELTPPEQQRAASQFITDNPASLASLYALNRFFLLKTGADYAKVGGLINKMAKAVPDDKRLSILNSRLKILSGSRKGDKLPTFSAVSTTGRRVSNADLNAPVNVVTVWSSWNYESQNIQRVLQRKYNDANGNLKVLSICVDADIKAARRAVTKDSVKWSTVCDGKLWDTPVLHALGLSYIPDNILIDDKGKIIAHSLTQNELMKKIDKLLPKQEEP
jgi:hypothetical protein